MALTDIDGTSTYAYNHFDLLCRETRIAYDLLNREISRREKDGGVSRIFYNRNNQPTKVISPKAYAIGGEEGAGLWTSKRPMAARSTMAMTMPAIGFRPPMEKGIPPPGATTRTISWR